MLPAAVALVVAGVYTGRKLKRPRQAAPLFAIAMVVAILASQAIAIGVPGIGTGVGHRRNRRNRGRTGDRIPGLFAVFAEPFPSRGRCGISCIGVACAGGVPRGIALMDRAGKTTSCTVFAGFLGKDIDAMDTGSVGFIDRRCLSGSEVAIVFLHHLRAAFPGLQFLEDHLPRHQAIPVPAWPWPFIILSIGLAVMAWLAWRDYRSERRRYR